MQFMQCAYCLSLIRLHSGAGPDFKVIGTQLEGADGEVLETHQECDSMTAWYRMQFVSFGKGSMTGWVRSDEVKLLPIEARLPTRDHVSSDPAAITILDTPEQRRKKRP